MTTTKDERKQIEKVFFVEFVEKVKNKKLDRND